LVLFTSEPLDSGVSIEVFYPGQRVLSIVVNPTIVFSRSSGSGGPLFSPLDKFPRLVFPPLTRFSVLPEGFLFFFFFFCPGTWEGKISSTLLLGQVETVRNAHPFPNRIGSQSPFFGFPFAGRCLFFLDHVVVLNLAGLFPASS